MISGVNDVSWNNHNLTNTKHLKKLAESGIILDNAYTLPICSPSRAAILTGVYPFKMGLQVNTKYEGYIGGVFNLILF